MKKRMTLSEECCIKGLLGASLDFSFKHLCTQEVLHHRRFDQRSSLSLEDICVVAGTLLPDFLS